MLELPPPAGAGEESVDSGVVSEEQVTSAFEIADTDGDGLLSHAEALEVTRTHSVYRGG